MGARFATGEGGETMSEIPSLEKMAKTFVRGFYTAHTLEERSREADRAQVELSFTAEEEQTDLSSSEENDE